jgi:hypothetical protein
MQMRNGSERMSAAPQSMWLSVLVLMLLDYPASFIVIGCGLLLAEQRFQKFIWRYVDVGVFEVVRQIARGNRKAG